MNAGTCDQPSASFAALPDLAADASGKAAATGKVLFRGAEDVALAAMADGQHVISIQTDQVVACGAIPPSAAVAAAAGMPETGGAAPWFVALVAALVLGLVVLIAALVLIRRRATPRA